MRLRPRSFVVGGGAAAITTAIVFGAVLVLSPGPSKAGAEEKSVTRHVRSPVMTHVIGRATFILQDTALGALGLGALILALVIQGLNCPEEPEEVSPEAD